jgi:hypothetical protein
MPWLLISDPQHGGLLMRAALWRPRMTVTSVPRAGRGTAGETINPAFTA